MMTLTDEAIAELKRDLPEWEATEEMFRERHNDGLTGAQEAAVAMTLRRMLAAFPALLAAARENATSREFLGTLHEHVAVACEALGLNRDEHMCDSWTLVERAKETARENATLRRLLTEASEAPSFIQHRYHCAAMSEVLALEEPENVACTCGRMGLLARIDVALAAGMEG